MELDHWLRATTFSVNSGARGGGLKPSHIEYSNVFTGFAKPDNHRIVSD